MTRLKSGARTNILFAVLYVFLFLLSAVSFLGKEPYIKPDLMLAAAAVCPLFCEKKSSALFALAAGFLTDISVTPPYHFSPVLFLACAYFVPRFAAVFSRINVFTALVCSVPLLLARALTGTVYLMSHYEGTSLSAVLKRSVMPELLANLAAVAAVYLIASALIRLFKLKRAVLF